MWCWLRSPPVCPALDPCPLPPAPLRLPRTWYWRRSPSSRMIRGTWTPYCWSRYCTASGGQYAMIWGSWTQYCWSMYCAASGVGGQYALQGRSTPARSCMHAHLIGGRGLRCLWPGGFNIWPGDSGNDVHGRACSPLSRHRPPCSCCASSPLSPPSTTSPPRCLSAGRGWLCRRRQSCRCGEKRGQCRWMDGQCYG